MTNASSGLFTNYNPEGFQQQTTSSLAGLNFVSSQGRIAGTGPISLNLIGPQQFAGIPATGFKTGVGSASHIYTLENQVMNLVTLFNKLKMDLNNF